MPTPSTLRSRSSCAEWKGRRTRQHTLRGLGLRGLGPLALVGALVGCGVQEAEPRREIVPRAIFLISIDTLRQDHMGLHGYERETTPSIDRLAASSLVFDRAYTTASWTLIAHMSLLTGTYPQQHGVLDTKSALSPQIPTLAERLKELGYHTMGFHFPGWLDAGYGYGRGFDHYESHRDAEEAQEHIFAALEQAPTDTPLFVFIHLFDVHNRPMGHKRSLIYDPPAPYDKLFMEDARERLEGVVARRLWTQKGVEVSPDKHAAIVAMYDGGIRYVDTKIGAWIERFKQLGLFEDSLFVVTSDHGEGLRQRTETYGGHGGSYEEGLRVPLIIRFPGGQFGGRRVAEPVSHVDVVPTLLEHMGAEPDERMAGFGLLQGRPTGIPIFAERGETSTVLIWPWKMTQKGGRRPATLYQLENDPTEANNLASRRRKAEVAERVESLVRIADESRRGRFQPEEEDLPEVTRSAETERLLRDLGYGGSD